ncbi:MAG: hypothetical protein IPJ77_15945 [Planctomycetes bacterium]|nr:hypothetical protein [Planctomycetota bacterium]
MKLAPALVVSVLALLAACCADDSAALRTSAGARSASDAPATIAGTLLDAASGEPVPNVTVRGPRSSSSRSDERGRFELDGLAVGDEGEVTAETGDGRRASVPVRPLRAGRLEVVLHLARAARDD